jgi:hypothetical protein
VITVGVDADAKAEFEEHGDWGEELNEWGDSHQGESSGEDEIIAEKVAKLLQTDGPNTPENRERVDYLLERIDFIKSMPAKSALVTLADNPDIVQQVCRKEVKPSIFVTLWDQKRDLLLNEKKNRLRPSRRGLWRKRHQRRH